MDKDATKRAYLTTTIIAGSMVMSVFVYAGVIWFLRSQGTIPIAQVAPEWLNAFSYAFYGISASLFVVLSALRGRMFSRTPGEEAGEVLTRLRAATITTFALGEAPAIMGLVLAFLGGRLRDLA